MGERVERQETGAWVSGVSSLGGALSGREKGCLRLCCRRLCVPPQAGVTASKTPEVGPLGAAEKKVRMLDEFTGTFCPCGEAIYTQMENCPAYKMSGKSYSVG